MTHIVYVKLWLLPLSSVWLLLCMPLALSHTSGMSKLIRDTVVEIFIFKENCRYSVFINGC